MEQITKEKIVAEYLCGGISLRKLQAKYGVDFRTLHGWVKTYKGQEVATRKKVVKQESNSAELLRLEAELARAKLHNKLLESLLDIGKEQYGLDLRKKAGTKRS